MHDSPTLLDSVPTVSEQPVKSFGLQETSCTSTEMKTMAQEWIDREDGEVGSPRKLTAWSYQHVYAHGHVAAMDAVNTPDIWYHRPHLRS